MSGHRGPVSALSLDHDEKGFFSAGWDGDALVSYLHGRNLEYSKRVFNSCGTLIQARK